ncbi:hypothetical protein PC111_g13420 [Phytophthora cactorum]|nr:hypothetical protein PC111_g13420 [Phytophthora cactorum]
MCGKPGHLKATCPNKKQKWGEGGDADFVLTVDDSTIKEGWKAALTASRLVKPDESKAAANLNKSSGWAMRYGKLSRSSLIAL